MLNRIRTFVDYAECQMLIGLDFLHYFFSRLVILLIFEKPEMPQASEGLFFNFDIQCCEILLPFPNACVTWSMFVMVQ